MNQRIGMHLFWGQVSPLSSLTGLALIVLASSRFSYALIITAAFLWVYGLASLIYAFTRKYIPAKGRMIVLLFLVTFLCGIFALFTSMINPLLIMTTSFFLVLIPPTCLGSGFFQAAELDNNHNPGELVSRALLEAAVLSALIIAFSLLREPLGFGTLSIPGSPGGIVELFYWANADGFILIRILSLSSGAILLLGYIIALYRYIGKQLGSISEDLR